MKTPEYIRRVIELWQQSITLRLAYRTPLS